MQMQPIMIILFIWQKKLIKTVKSDQFVITELCIILIQNEIISSYFRRTKKRTSITYVVY